MRIAPYSLAAAVVAGGLSSLCHAEAGATKAAHIGFGVHHMDLSVAPGQDFSRFAWGGWRERNQIPADKARWGSFNELEEANQQRLKAILEAAMAEGSNGGPVARQVGDFYASGIDVAKINELGLKPIEAELAALREVKDRDGLFRFVARMQLRLGSPFFSYSCGPDAKKADTYALRLGQGGMSLPSRDYYFSERFARERWEFVGHVARLLELAGESRATAYRAGEVVFAVEQSLAQQAKTPVELRDREANYHKMPVAAAAQGYPDFPVKLLLTELGVPATIGEIIVAQPKFFEGLSAELKSRPLDELKVYVRYHLLRASASALSEPIDAEVFRFYSTVLNGTPQQEPRWQRAVRRVDGLLPEALGQLYVARHFPPAAKARMMDMIGNITVVMRERLEKAEWMTEATRQKALAKFARFQPMIGHPDKWLDTSSVEIRRDDFYGNVVRATHFEVRRQIARLGQKVDPAEWRMSAPTVNAYYSPTENRIVFPAGILQPPFFDPNMDDAVNYGAIGGVIGHEITHGFDDQGRKSDADGNLTDWWTPEDATRFREKAQKLVEQFNSYHALPGLAINGQLSLGENIADLGGTSIAFEAYQRSLRGRPAPAKIDGFTAEQRFFIAWAQVWRTLIRDDALRLQVTRGPHAPGAFRSYGPLVNQAAFIEAFGIKEGDAVWRKPEDRAKVW